MLRAGQTYITAVLLIAVVMLLGYHRLFVGADFFVEEDPTILFDYAKRTALGNGWRPDKGFGLSFFYGDPGAFHAWSVFPLWEKLVPLGVSSFTISVVALLFLAAVTQYVFLRRLAPSLGPVLPLLATLIVFGPLQHEFFFQRHWITLSIGVPLLLLLLADYYREPKLNHLFQTGLLLWFVWFFGSYVGFLDLLAVGALFSVAHFLWERPPALRLIVRASVIFGAGVVVTLGLGAWVFYTVFCEWSLVTYLRDQVSTALVGYVREAESPARDLFNLPGFINASTKVFHSSWLPSQLVLPISDLLPVGWISWSNVSPVFPLVLVLALSRRATDYWDFVLRVMLVTLLVHEVVIDAVPLYGHVLGGGAVTGYGLAKFHPAYHPLQLALLAMVLLRLGGDAPGSAGAGRWVRRGLALLLMALYGILALLVVIAAMKPHLLPGVAARLARAWAEARPGWYPPELAGMAATFAVQRVTASMGWLTFGFYASSLVLVLVFARDGWSKRVAIGSRTVVAGLLALNGILLSWAMFPLNERPTVWAEAQGAGASFRPTDRFYEVFDRRVQRVRTVEDFRRVWLDSELGPPEPRAGYNIPPALNLSSTKSFVQADVAAFTFRAFSPRGVPEIASVREVTYWGPFVLSELLDMAAVSHYFSRRELPDAPTLELVFRAKQLFVYRNTEAWPYFYLAERIAAAPGAQPPARPLRGTAYVAERDAFVLGDEAPAGRIALQQFTDGRMVFRYESARMEFLVVADAWHPLWRAEVDGTPAPVVRANGIFKGVKLPPGAHGLTLTFDTSPFTPGIYIAAAAWGVFATAWLVLRWTGRIERPLPL